MVVMSGKMQPTPSGTKRNTMAKRAFQIVLIKPSHYDADGYVIQWYRSVMPSNSLAALYGLAVDAAERQVLGPDVAIDVTPVDETNTRIRPKKIIASKGLVFMWAWRPTRRFSTTEACLNSARFWKVRPMPIAA